MHFGFIAVEGYTGMTGTVQVVGVVAELLADVMSGVGVRKTGNITVGRVVGVESVLP